MIGTVEFNSSCFYRYANIDLDQLKKNLGEDDTLTKEAVENFVRAFIHAVPTGKQNSMAAQNPPSMVLAVVRETGLWSLANAFANPVRSKGDKSLLQNSMEALDEYWGRLAKVYGDGSIKETAIVLVEEADLKNLKAAEVDSIEALVKKTVSKTRL
jgi:CRISPR system Cascade subunit CasC